MAAFERRRFRDARHSSTLLRLLNDQRMEGGALCDVSVIVEGVCYPAHCCVLAACSSYFRRLLCGHPGTDRPAVLQLDFVRPAVFEAVLAYMYTAEISVQPEDLELVVASGRALGVAFVDEICAEKRGALCEGHSCQPMPSSVAGSAPRPIPVSPSEGRRKARYPYSISDRIHRPVMAPCRRRSHDCLEAEKGQGAVAIVVNGPYSGSLGESLGSGVSGHGSSCEHACGVSGGLYRCSTPGALAGPVALASVAEQSRHHHHHRHLMPSEQDFLGGEDMDALRKAAVDSEATENLDYFVGVGGSGGGGGGGSGGGTYFCEQCGRAFSSEPRLRAHEQHHVAERPFTCIMCDKAYMQQPHLREHMKQVHMGLKPFACTRCGKAFARGPDLKKHERVHTNERPFMCPLCLKAFKHKSHLKDHERRHRGERPFVCRVCLKAFGKTSDLKRHLNTMHGQHASPLSPSQLMGGGGGDGSDISHIAGAAGL
ncbi:zinc finger and BTB domain-containing protein 14-like isoform X1 [Lethenteron reissneri]|uniref:zinc finger and BTB domain-containing protein 14-like isoform X1 n=1 Tax=Lethenteron reissneri TaxID=7753 RepID=UPI002AB77875|nr:zinc finger and BTB domain-containing protein 14-like isoform X1 [Lethenteron reissneri]XP_061418605.1 zinc finger and BTB domain-containing protein 14-like isoform X1 [Lethenteron reissneri]